MEKLGFCLERAFLLKCKFRKRGPRLRSTEQLHSSAIPSALRSTGGQTHGLARSCSGFGRTMASAKIIHPACDAIAPARHLPHYFTHSKSRTFAPVNGAGERAPAGYSRRRCPVDPSAYLCASYPYGHSISVAWERPKQLAFQKKGKL